MCVLASLSICSLVLQSSAKARRVERNEEGSERNLIDNVVERRKADLAAATAVRGATSSKDLAEQRHDLSRAKRKERQ